jgi:DNA-binding LytR/AlgR family response regulator
MPGMSGLELYEKIKQIDHGIEVCFITAFDEYYGQLAPIHIRTCKESTTTWFCLSGLISKAQSIFTIEFM